MAGDLRHTDGETVSECSILATLRTPAPATHPHHCTPVLHSTAHSTAPGHRTSNHQASKMLLLNSSRNTAVNIDRGQTLVQLDLFLLVAAKRNNKSPICCGDIIFQ